MVLLSHNGMDVDLKLASRVTGIDVILGGHTHDAVPQPIQVANAGGTTLVTNAGSGGNSPERPRSRTRKRQGQAIFEYRLLPVFSELLKPDAAMAALVQKMREPHAAAYRQEDRTTAWTGCSIIRNNFGGTVDQLISALTL